MAHVEVVAAEAHAERAAAGVLGGEVGLGGLLVAPAMGGKRGQAERKVIWRELLNGSEIHEAKCANLSCVVEREQLRALTTRTGGAPWSHHTHPEQPKRRGRQHKVTRSARFRRGTAAATAREGCTPFWSHRSLPDQRGSANGSGFSPPGAPPPPG